MFLGGIKLKNRIKKLREDNELTLKELSSLSDIPYQTLRNYEIGKRKPRNDEVWVKLGRILNVRGPYLKGEDNIATYDEIRLYYLEQGTEEKNPICGDINSQIEDLLSNLNENGKQEAIRQLTLLIKINEFRK